MYVRCIFCESNYWFLVLIFRWVYVTYHIVLKSDIISSSHNIFLARTYARIIIIKTVYLYVNVALACMRVWVLKFFKGFQIV